MPALAGRLLRAGRALSPALFAADERHPRTRGRRERGARRLPSARCRRLRRRTRSWRGPLLPRRRRARGGGHGLRDAHRPSRGQDRRARQPVGVGRQVARRLRLRDRFLRRSDGDSDRCRQDPTGVGGGRSDRPGRTRPRRSRRLHRHQPCPGTAHRGGGSGAAARGGSGPRVDWPARRHHRGRVDGSRPSTWPTPAPRSISSWRATRWRHASTNAGAVFVGPWTAQVAGDYAIGSNHVLPTAGRGTLSRWAERCGLREAGLGPARVRTGPAPNRWRHHRPGPRRRVEGHARSIERTEPGALGAPGPQDPRPSKTPRPQALETRTPRSTRT